MHESNIDYLILVFNRMKKERDDNVFAN